MRTKKAIYFALFWWPSPIKLDLSTAKTRALAFLGCIGKLRKIPQAIIATANNLPAAINIINTPLPTLSVQIKRKAARAALVCGTIDILLVADASYFFVIGNWVTSAIISYTVACLSIALIWLWTVAAAPSEDLQ